MKVAILSPYPTRQFQQELGCRQLSHQNNATWTVVLARSLAQLPNTEVHVVTETEDIPASKTVTADGVRIHFVRSPARFKTLTLWQMDRYRLHRALRAIKPDIVHGQGIEHQYGHAAVTCRHPQLITIHGLQVLANRIAPPPALSRLRLVEILERHCLKRARFIVAINPFLLQAHGIDWQRYRIFHIANPVAEEFFAPSAVSREPDLIIALGSVDRLKGFDVLIEAVARLSRQGVRARVKLIGYSPPGHDAYLSMLNALIRDHKLDVEFAGFLERPAVLGLMRRCAVLVHPSRHEHAPMAVAEGLSVGAPVVAADVGGVRHMFEDGRSGLLFPSENADALTDRLRTLLTNPDRGAALGQAARDHAAKIFHPRPVAEQTRQAYTEVLNHWKVN